MDKPPNSILAHKKKIVDKQGRFNFSCWVVSQPEVNFVTRSSKLPVKVGVVRGQLR